MRQRKTSTGVHGVALFAIACLCALPSQNEAPEAQDQPAATDAPASDDGPTSANGTAEGVTDAYGFAAELESSDPLTAAAIVREELRDNADAPTLEQQELAYRLGTALVRLGELDAAVALQLDLHARVAAEWSAINAVLTLTRLGRRAEAAELLDAALARAPESPALLDHRGLVALAAGDLNGAKRWFGSGALFGSADAAVNLGRMALRAGQRTRALTWFRAGVAGPEPGAWSLRGYGLSLLP